MQGIDEPVGQPPGGRSASLDGLRGVTIILVMVGHAGDLLWPITRIFDIPGIRGFFGGGAVGVFFIISGFVVGRGLLRDHRKGELDPVRFYVRRLIRLGVQVVPLAIAIVVVRLVDTSDDHPVRFTVLSALNTVTHTYNQFAATNLLATRSDLGHMWYLSVLQQVYLVVPLLFLLLARHRRYFTAVLVALIVLSIVWRQHVLSTQDWVMATISTIARADAILLGLLIALHLDWLRTRLSERVAGGIAMVGMAIMIGLIAILKELPGNFNYLKGWGIAFTLTAAVTILGLVLGRASPASKLLSGSALGSVGRASFVLFIWHLPVFAFVARHTQAWSWESRTILALTILGVLATVLNITIEEPTRRWLGQNLRPTSGTRPTPEKVSA